jgi:hypothetical protein
MHNFLDACISIMIMHYAQGCINHRCIGCFMHTSSLVTLTGCIIGRFRAHTVGSGGAGE